MSVKADIVIKTVWGSIPEDPEQLEKEIPIQNISRLIFHVPASVELSDAEIKALNNHLNYAAIGMDQLVLLTQCDINRFPGPNHRRYRIGNVFEEVLSVF